MSVMNGGLVAAVIDQGALTLDLAVPGEVFGVDRCGIVTRPGTTSGSSPSTAPSAPRPAS